MKLCPVHNMPLTASEMRWGKRWACPDPECDVAGWSGRTSTPADAATRAARMEAHAAFDPLWRDELYWFSRESAYAWLRAVMGLSREDAHIERFDKAQCERLLAELEQLAEMEATV